MNILQSATPLAILQAISPLNAVKPFIKLITPTNPLLRLNQIMASQKVYLLFDKVYQLLGLPSEPRSLPALIVACSFLSSGLAISVTLGGELFISTLPAIQKIVALFFKMWGIPSSVPTFLSFASIGGLVLSAVCIISGIIGLAVLTHEYQQVNQGDDIINYFKFINKNRESKALACFQYTLLIQKICIYTLLFLALPNFFLSVLPAVLEHISLSIACCIIPTLMMVLLLCSRDHREFKNTGLDEGLVHDNHQSFRKLFIAMDIGNILQNIYFPSPLSLGILATHALCLLDDLAQWALNPEHKKPQSCIKNLSRKYW